MHKNKLWYIIFLTILTLLAILYNSYYTGIVVFAFILLPVVSKLVLLYAGKHIKVSLAGETGTAVNGDNFKIILQAENTSRIPVGKIYVDTEYKNLRIDGTTYAKKMKRKAAEKQQNSTYIISLESKHSQQLYLNAYSKHCGRVVFRITKAYATDWLGLFKVKPKIAGKEVDMVIIPSINEIEMELPIMNMDSDAAADEYSKTKKGDDASEIFDIRPYREGDRLNRVHWKLSAKENEIIIKEYSMPMSWAVDILVNYGDGRPDEYDKILQDFMSVSYRLVSAGINHCAVWYDTAQKCCRRENISDEEGLYLTVGYMLEYKNCDVDFLESYKAEILSQSCKFIYYIATEETKDQFDEFAYEFEGIKCARIS